MNNVPAGYTVKLVYYGRADLVDASWDTKANKWERTPISPQISTQNIRIIAFPSADPGAIDQIGIYELVRNAEAPKSDLEGTKIA